METLAQDQGVTVEEFIYTSLLNLEGAHDPDEIEKLLPGFKEAMEFP